MKVQRVIILFFVSLVFLLSYSFISNAEAANIWPTTAKTLCWEFTMDGETVLAKMRSFPIGASNYILSGRITLGNTTLNVVNGSAVVLTSVLITLNAAGKDSESMGTSTCYMVLNGTTLNGTYECLGQEYNRDTKSINTKMYTSGSMTKITCP
jgi:hypothetical protein